MLKPQSPSVQGRIAGAHTSVYKFDSVAIGQHVYKCMDSIQLQNAYIKCILWEDNEHDKYAVNDQL